MERAELIAAAFKIRCSAIHEIVGGTVGLTEVQTARMKELADRDSGIGKPLTDNMKAELAKLKMKFTFPELPDGAKTYCKKWLKEYLYKRRADIKSKYIDKGNATEEDGFTAMCLELDLGMVYKNTQFHSNENIQGTDDLFVKGVVYDNKSSWSLDTFPMFDKEIPDDKYEWQVNGYQELRGVKDGYVVYTLIDAPIELIEREIKWLTDHNEIYRKVCNMVYTTSFFNQLQAQYFPDATHDYFVEIPQSERVKAFNVPYDQQKIKTINERVPMCRTYILTLLS